MLKITPEAGLAIRTLTDRQGAPADGGLRIKTLTGEDRRPQFFLSVVEKTDERDQIVVEETTGARVLLDSLTAEHLDERSLDVVATLEGVARFNLKPNIHPA